MENKFQHIDDLFRSRFENFEPQPPEHVWTKIFKKINPGKGGSGFGKTFLLTSISVISITAILLFILNPFSNSENTLANSTVKVPQDNELIAQAVIVQNNEDIIEETVTETDITEAAISEVTKNQQSTSEFKPNDVIELTTVKSPVTIPVPDTPQDIVKHTSIDNSINNASGQLSLIPALETVRIQLAYEDNVFNNPKKVSIDEINRFVGDETANSKSDHYFKLGAFINPEVVFYPDDSVDNSRNYNFAIDFRYYKGSFFIQSGLGISIARDEGKYQVDYNEFLGTYERVYDVSFDSTESGIIPTYFTKTVEVYDSIEHMSISKTKNTYTYLQIPVLVGYQIEGKNLSYSFMAGPSLSILMHKSIPDPELPVNVRIINVNKNIASRIETNWQMVVGFGLNYRIDKRFEVAIEPTFRYYLNSNYEGNIIKSKHPLSFGLRAGVLFKL